MPIDRDMFRENLVKYTRRAFQMLPELEKPSILDIGCGSGIPTLELARLCDGHITGVDIDQTLLDKLERKSIEEGFSERISPIKCSLQEMDFADESFDIIWAEGVAWVLGFEQSLMKWKRLIKPNGFLVIHDESKGIQSKLEHTAKYDYHLIGYFEVSHEVHWSEYYEQLEEYIDDIETSQIDNSSQNELDDIRNEIETFKLNPVGSIFFVMQN